MNASTIEINLELELSGETVSGRAHCADGSVRKFSGWIGLMALVDSLLDGARDGARPATQTREERTRDVNGNNGS